MKNILIWLLLYYLRFFARLALFLHKPKVIGITGSVGKSSTRNAMYAMMKDYFRVKMVKEGNSETGIPLGILGIDPGHYKVTNWLRTILFAPFKINNLKGTEYLIVEMGIDSPYPPKNMDYLLTIVKPDIAILLNVYPVHTMQFDELFESGLNEEKRIKYIVSRIAKEKAKIITKANPKLGIYNENVGLKLNNPRLLSFGTSNDADIRFMDYRVDLKKTSFKYLLLNKNDEIEISIKNFVLPKAYLEVFAVTLAVGKELGLKDEQISEGISKNFTMPAGRGSIFAGINSSIVVDSSYNASRAAVLTYLQMVEELSEKENRPFVLMLGDMRELGQEAKAEHEAVAQKIIDLKVDRVYGVGPLTRQYVIPKVKKAVKEVKWFKTTLQAGDYLRRTLPYRAIVLVKGSQNEIFLEETVKKILKNKSDEKSFLSGSITSREAVFFLLFLNREVNQFVKKVRILNARLTE
jgi:UDP-N-acetylmuramoyl-tripeptide--D-alanyl-D-alanine ligase